jgi:polyisoprenoid-binding protein YceI
MADPQTAAARHQTGGFKGRWVLDPAGSKAEFAVRHFWGAVTVRGQFEAIAGEASVDETGAITGQLTFDATSLNTRNKQRDKHLKSADFFHAERHPSVVLTVTKATVGQDGQVAVAGTLEAAGHSRPVTFTAHAEEIAENAATVRAEVTVDRFDFGMTWRPMGIAAREATGTVVARFVRG